MRGSHLVLGCLDSSGVSTLGAEKLFAWVPEQNGVVFTLLVHEM